MIVGNIQTLDNPFIPKSWDDGHQYVQWGNREQYIIPMNDVKDKYHMVFNDKQKLGKKRERKAMTLYLRVLL